MASLDFSVIEIRHVWLTAWRIFNSQFVEKTEVPFEQYSHDYLLCPVHNDSKHLGSSSSSLTIRKQEYSAGYRFNHHAALQESLWQIIGYILKSIVLQAESLQFLHRNLSNEMSTIPPNLLARQSGGSPQKSSKTSSNNLEVVQKLQKKFFWGEGY